MANILVRFLLAVGLSSASAASLPVVFEPNAGQASPAIRFLARSHGHSYALSPTGATLHAHSGPEAEQLGMQIVRGNPNARMEGAGLEPSVSNYYLGSDPARWRSGVPNYSRVRVHDVYPGIDLVYYGADGEAKGQIEYDFEVRPGANPEVIRLRFPSQNPVKLTGNGALLVRGRNGEVEHRSPVAYQNGKIGRSRVAVRFRRFAGGEFGFEVGPRDPALPLVIDPVLRYSSYLGGSGLDEGRGVSTDADGNAYVTGWTTSPDFPVAANKTFADVFVVKLNPAGTSRLYSTYFGGSLDDIGHGIDASPNGVVHVVGATSSSNFPSTGAAQAFGGGGSDAFLVRLNNAGAITYSTFLGGNTGDEARGVAVDSGGLASVAGWTTSANYPVTAGARQSSYGGNTDAFYARLNPAIAGAGSLLYSTFLGGSSLDTATGVAVDGGGNAYVAGSTLSTNFPVQNQFQGAGGSSDAFLAKINPAAAGAASLLYSTYLGGQSLDEGRAVAVDAFGNAYVAGFTDSANFPVSAGAAQGASAGATVDAFFTKLNPGLSGAASLLYSTYLGGTGSDIAQAIAVDISGTARIAGETSSGNFPNRGSLRDFSGALDAFIAYINPALSGADGLWFSSYFGGTGNDSARGIACVRNGDCHVAGITTSGNFPATAGVTQITAGGGIEDGFLFRVSGAMSSPGIFRGGFFWLQDVDANRQFNLPPDRAFAFGGVPGDVPLAGDWNGDGVTDIGVYRPSNGFFLLDFDGDRLFNAATDKFFNLGVGTEPADVPVVGDWNGSGTAKVGIFRQGFFWILDTNGNGVFQQGIEQAVAFGGVAGDQPVVGDWDGDGRSNLGLVRLGFFWILDQNGNGVIDNVNQANGDRAFAFGGLNGDIPVVGDWNGDGKSKPGMFRAGFFWVLDANGNSQFDGTGVGQDLAFPFGGLGGDKPVVGRW